MYTILERGVGQREGDRWVATERRDGRNRETDKRWNKV